MHPLRRIRYSHFLIDWKFLVYALYGCLDVLVMLYALIKYNFQAMYLFFSVSINHEYWCSKFTKIINCYHISGFVSFYFLIFFRLLKLNNQIDPKPYIYFAYTQLKRYLRSKYCSYYNFRTV